MPIKMPIEGKLKRAHYFYQLFYMRQRSQKHWFNLWDMWLSLIFWTVSLGFMTACTSTERMSIEEPILISTPTLMTTAVPVNEIVSVTPPITSTQIAQLAVTVSSLDNVETPFPTVTSMPTPTATPDIYVIQTGDTLLGIAGTQYVNYNDFLAINDIDNPDGHLILPGNVLLLPPPGYFEQPDGQIVYKVEEGDTFNSIATIYGIPVNNLMNANPDITTPKALPIGYELTVPWGGIHFVAPGETLLEIAIRYGVSVDDLVMANAKEFPTLSLDIDDIQIGWKFAIPFQDEGGVAISDEYDCSPQSPQTEVISYTVRNGERLICLSSKFGVSETTLLNANPEIWGEGRLTDSTAILIPPSDGALYTLTVADADNDVNLDDIARWYGIRELNSIVDWQRQPISLPIQAGQRLFIPNADPVALSFNVIAAKGLEEPVTAPTTVVSNPKPNPEPGNPSQQPITPDIPVPSDSRGIHYRWWDGEYGKSSPGYCPYTVGTGWSNTLKWPVTGRTIYEDRKFRSGHNGIDINMPIGSPVYAAATGTVIWAGYSPFGGGFLVFLAHGNEWRTAYAHLSSVNVNCGDVISQGALLGLSGDTATYFPHVHLEVVHGNTVQDPFLWLPNEAVYRPRP